MNPAYINLLNVLGQQKQANDALIPSRPIVPGNLATPQTDEGQYQAIAEGRYAASAQALLQDGAAANPAVVPTAPETINQQMNSEVNQKIAALVNGAKAYAGDVFNSLVAEHIQKQAAAEFAQLPPAEQQAYLELAQKAAALEEQGFVFVEGLGYVHPSQAVKF